MGYGATKEFIKVLRLLERFSLGDLTAAMSLSSFLCKWAWSGVS
jgi:hypothetical protein